MRVCRDRGRRSRRSPWLAACLLLAASGTASPLAAQPEIVELGEPGVNGFSFVDRGARLSIWAERVPAEFILEELADWGGPTYMSLEPLTRPVTLTLHDVPIETMLRRMLEGYNFTLHYKGGKLAHVRVLHMMPERHYKVVDAIESRAEWTRIELAGDSDGRPASDEHVEEPPSPASDGRRRATGD